MNRHFVALGVTGWLMLSSWTIVQGAGGNSSLNFVHALTQACFPDLIGQHVGIRLSTALGPSSAGDQLVRIEVGCFTVASETVELRPTDVVIAGLFDSMADSWSLYFKGPYVSSDAMARLESVVRSHPEWRAREVSEAVRSVGGRFGPDEGGEALTAFDVGRFSAVLGQVQRSEAHWRGEPGEEPWSPNWVINFETKDERNQRHCFSVAAEIIHLRVTSISARECR